MWHERLMLETQTVILRAILAKLDERPDGRAIGRVLHDSLPMAFGLDVVTAAAVRSTIGEWLASPPPPIASPWIIMP